MTAWLRFWWGWMKCGRTYLALLKEIDRAERLAALLAWTAAGSQRSIGDQAEDWLASLEKVNPEVEGDGA